MPLFRGSKCVTYQHMLPSNTMCLFSHWSTSTCYICEDSPGGIFCLKQIFQSVDRAILSAIYDIFFLWYIHTNFIYHIYLIIKTVICRISEQQFFFFSIFLRMVHPHKVKWAEGVVDAGFGASCEYGVFTLWHPENGHKLNGFLQYRGIWNGNNIGPNH